MEELTLLKKTIINSCCIIRINEQDKGTGWVGPDNSIISAGHCFTDGNAIGVINPDQINRKKIQALFLSDTENYPFSEVQCKIYELVFLQGIYSENPLVDYCILKASNRITEKALPIANDLCLEGKFYTAGIGKGLNRISSAEGDIVGQIQYEKGYPGIKLSSEQCGIGYSGCPIYSVLAKGVIGIQSQITKNDIGAEANTKIAFQTRYLIDNGIITGSTSSLSSEVISDLDIAMDLRNQGDIFWGQGDYYSARSSYSKAKEYLAKATGQKGAYINDINKRITSCRFPKSK